MDMMNTKQTPQHGVVVLRRIIPIAIILYFSFLSSSSAQVFWTETFGTGCNQGVFANGFATANGSWSVASSGINDVYSNQWYISGTESGFPAGSCGDGCLINPTLTNQTLHVGNVMGSPSSAPCPAGDCGALYDHGGVTPNQVRTSRLAYSPLINCTGKNNIILEFNYIENGDTNVDNTTVQYFNGTTWTFLSDTYKTNATLCGGPGRWTHFSYPLPPSANNNSQVRIGFDWKNNDDAAGSGPSFAVDSITLRPAIGTITAGFKVDSNNTCAGLPSIFSDTSTGNPNTWLWLFPNGVPSSSTSQNPTVTYNVTGTFSVTLISSNTLSSDTATGTITINNCSRPVANFAGNPLVICRNHCVNFTDLSQNSPTSWQWSFPGSSTPFSASANPLNICYPNSGLKNVKLVVSNAFGTDSITRLAYIQVDSCPAPVADFNPSTTVFGCDTVCVDFADASSNSPSQWLWTFQGGTPGSSTLRNPTNICYTSDGLYDVTLVASNGGGSGTIIKYSLINISSVPGATISGSAPDDTVDFGGTDTLTVTGGTSYLWLPSQGLNPDSSTNPIVLVSPLETTTYTCLVTDAFTGCRTVRSITVHIRHKKHVFFIPDAFSPNADGANDKFYVRGNDIFSVHLAVFDRWGEKIFDSEDKYIGWDGNYRGEKVAMGVYTYVAFIVFGDGFSQSKFGTIALVR